MKRFSLAFLLVIFFINTVHPAIVDTLSVYSNSMDKEIKVVIIKPESYKGDKSLPVLYLLHGQGDSYDGWVQKVPSVKELADLHDIFIVCLVGGANGWDWEIPVCASVRYEVFGAGELFNRENVM